MTMLAALTCIDCVYRYYTAYYIDLSVVINDDPTIFVIVGEVGVYMYIYIVC